MPSSLTSAVASRGWLAGRADGRPLLRGWLHALMAPLSLAGVWFLWASVTSAGADRLPVLVFGGTMVGLYSVSSLYHVPRWGQRARRVLSRCDGAMIQLFIAGTFTPVAFHALDGGWRVGSLAIAWTVAIVGAVVAASPLSVPRRLGTLGYVAVGWLLVVPFVRVVGALPWEGAGLIALGGVLYTVGAVVYARRWPDPLPTVFGFHEIFHLFVVAASTVHYLAIWRYVLPIG